MFIFGCFINLKKIFLEDNNYKWYGKIICMILMERGREKGKIGGNG